MLFRETNELQQWIHEKEATLANEEMGADLEQVEVLQKKFDDFQKVGDEWQRGEKDTKHIPSRNLGGGNKIVKMGNF